MIPADATIAAAAAAIVEHNVGCCAKNSSTLLIVSTAHTGLEMAGGAGGECVESTRDALEKWREKAS